MKSFVLDNATLWVGDGTTYAGHVVVADGIIDAAAPGAYRGSLPKEDLRGAVLSPGMIDLMVMGGFDKSILRDDPLSIPREYVRLGVTSCQFTIGTLPWESMQQVAENTRTAMAYDGNDAATVIGVYLEGPFQQPELTGASLRDFAQLPSTENVQRILDTFGDALTTINVAPGLEGDAEAVAMLTEAGKVVSMAHSDGPIDRIRPCIDAGTSVLGHAWDNNSGRIGDSGVQQPTLEHAALTDERIRAIHLICDGVHVHPVMILMTLRCRGTASICLVTDAVTRAGCPDGPYTWDDGRAFYKEGGVGRTDTGWLCGSATLLPDMFRNFVRFTGVPPHKAIRTVTLNPALSLGMENRIGILARGRKADLALWDGSARVRRVWKSGEEVPNVSEFGEVEI